MPENPRPPRPSTTPPADQQPTTGEPEGISEEQELTPEERARLSEEALRLLGGGTPLSKEELAEDPYINYRQ